MKYKVKILIGGLALENLGSSRSTEDTDYLILDDKDSRIFIRDEDKNIDYINAGSSDFFKEIFDKETKIERMSYIGVQASVDSLLELKCYALVQHLLNGNWAKATDCEYDIAFLIRKGAKYPSIVKKYLSAAEWAEIEKEIKSVRI